MSHPTDYAVGLIKNYISTNISGGFAQDDIYLCDTLNSPSYAPNPVPQGNVYTNFTAPNVFAVISPSSIRNILDSPGTAVAVLPLLNTLPHTDANISLSLVWAQAYAFSEPPVMTISDYMAVTGVLLEKIPDPSYVSGISWSQVNLGRPCDLDDIQSSR